MVFRIERTALTDMCGQRINNLGEDLETLRREAVMWAPGHPAHGRPMFDVMRYEPGRVGKGAGWVVADVDETIKRLLARSELCIISRTQWQETGKQVAVALLVRGTALGWRRDSDPVRTPRDIHLTRDALGMWSEKAKGARWPVWVRDSLRPALIELAHPSRLVDFAVMETKRGATDVTIKVDRRAIKEVEGGVLTGIKPHKLYRWVGPDAARTPGMTWTRAYAVENSRKSQKAVADAKTEELVGWEAKLRQREADLMRRLADIERRERALAQAQAGKPVATAPAPQPAAQAQVARRIQVPGKIKVPNFSRGR